MFVVCTLGRWTFIQNSLDFIHENVFIIRERFRLQFTPLSRQPLVTPQLVDILKYVVTDLFAVPEP